MEAKAARNETRGSVMADLASPPVSNSQPSPGSSSMAGGGVINHVALLSKSYSSEFTPANGTRSSPEAEEEEGEYEDVGDDMAYNYIDLGKGEGEREVGDVPATEQSLQLNVFVSNSACILKS